MQRCSSEAPQTTSETEKWIRACHCASHCRNVVAKFILEINSLKAPIARDLAGQLNENDNVVTSQLLVFLDYYYLGIDRSIGVADGSTADPTLF